jgi:hypothetical protein
MFHVPGNYMGQFIFAVYQKAPITIIFRADPNEAIVFFDALFVES